MKSNRIALGLALTLAPILSGVMQPVERINLVTHSSITDAEWEGMTSEQQDASHCFEDEPCWDCETMGNKICGSLPRTS